MVNYVLFVCLFVFNATFNNISVISWRSVLLVEETGVPGVDRIICLLCVYICHIFPFYYLDIEFFFGRNKKKKGKKVNVQIIKRKYIMTNINTQETDYSVYTRAKPPTCRKSLTNFIT
jgi:predicted permease